MSVNVIVRDSTPQSSYVLRVDAIAETKYTIEQTDEDRAFDTVLSYFREAVQRFKKKAHELYLEK